MKKYKSGLIIGKFMPLHLGHCHLIRTAEEQCEKLTVLVCALKSEPISGELRYAWVKEEFPNINIILVTDNNPYRLNDLSTEFKSSSDDFFWNLWIDIIKSHLKEVDVLFTSEEYGEELVEKLNSSKYNFHVEHNIVDLSRETFPVSGTMVRSNPFKYWEYIPSSVKPHYAKKIAIVGPESTGKTTMAMRLAKHFKTTYVAEYGREFTEGKYMGMDTEEFSLEDISKIAAGHLFREEQELKKSNKLFFADTETIVTEVWSQIYFGKTPGWIRDINKINPYKYSFYFLMDVDVPWISDGTRHMENLSLRQKHFETLRRELMDRNVPFAIVNGGYEERFQKIICGINSFVLNDIETFE